MNSRKGLSTAHDGQQVLGNISYYRYDHPHHKPTITVNVTVLLWPMCKPRFRLSDCPKLSQKIRGKLAFKTHTEALPISSPNTFRFPRTLNQNVPISWMRESKSWAAWVSHRLRTGTLTFRNLAHKERGKCTLIYAQNVTWRRERGQRERKGEGTGRKVGPTHRCDPRRVLSRVWDQMPHMENEGNNCIVNVTQTVL